MGIGGRAPRSPVGPVGDPGSVPKASDCFEVPSFIGFFAHTDRLTRYPLRTISALEIQLSPKISREIQWRRNLTRLVNAQVTAESCHFTIGARAESVAFTSCLRNRIARSKSSRLTA